MTTPVVLIDGVRSVLGYESRNEHAGVLADAPPSTPLNWLFLWIGPVPRVGRPGPTRSRYNGRVRRPPPADRPADSA